MSVEILIPALGFLAILAISIAAKNEKSVFFMRRWAQLEPVKNDEREKNPFQS